MLPSRFLRPGDVLEVDIQDMGVKSDAGDEVLLVAVNKSQQVVVRLSTPHERSNRSSEETARIDAHSWAIAVCSQLSGIRVHGRGDATLMQVVERDHRIWACRSSTCTGDGGETGGVAARSTRRTVQDLASQMGRVCTKTGTINPSYHAGPALTGEANSLQSFLL